MSNTLIEKITEAFEENQAKELHVLDIAEYLSRRFPTDFSNIEETKNKVSSSLASNVKAKSPLFRKVKNKNKKSFKKGVYALKGKRSKKIDFIQHKIDVTKMNTGRGGEFAVISELIFIGHNATLLPVDNGIDVISSKEDKFFHIQVKTKLLEAKDTYASYSIRKQAYETNRRSNDFYVFVLRKADGTRWVCDFIVLHASQLENAYHASSKDTSFSVKFEFINKKIYLRKTDVTGSLNNFSKIH